MLNRTLDRPILKKTPYELYKGRKPSVRHLRVFGCKCFVLNNGKENLGKFDVKSDEGVHIGYALNGHAYCTDQVIGCDDVDKRKGVVKKST